MSDKAKQLSPRQRQALDYIIQYKINHGYPPSWREIGIALGIEDTNAVSDHLLALKKKGYITWQPKIARTLIVLVNPNA